MLPSHDRKWGRTTNGWIAYLVVGVIVCVAYYLLPRAGVAQAVALCAINVSAAAFAYRAAGHASGPYRVVWVSLAVSMTLGSLANIAYYGYPLITGRPVPFPCPVDALWLLTYPCFLVALVALAKGRSMQDRAGNLLDALIVVFAGATLMWVYVLAPAVHSSALPVLGHVVSVLYPTMDLVVFVALVRLVVGSRRNRSMSLLVGSFCALLSADVVYAVALGNGTYHFGGATDGPWMLSYLLIGVAAAHPTFGSIKQPTVSDGLNISYGRLVFLGGALLVGPLLLAMDAREVVIVACSSVVSLLLVLARMTWLNRRLAALGGDLGRARDEAVEASRAKSDFLAVMSHEIRTPMNGVIGLTGLLLDSPLNETQRRQASGVRASGEALLTIINDILDFSKIEAGKLEIETVDFDLAQAIEDVAALVADSAHSKGLELVAYCRPDAPTALRGDVGRLRQILLNLATNAVKFTEQGEIVLRAGRAGRADWADGIEPADELGPDQMVVRFEVTDTGIGIEPASARRLFDPFAQADVSTTRRYGGTGLGLAICRRLAEAMGGSIGLNSRPGDGTTFWVELPFEHALAPVRAPASSTGFPLHDKKLLVVDDNETNCDVLVAQLRAWDITADLANDARSALVLLRRALVEGRPYDLALVDMAMPGMDGLDLARIVCDDPGLASTRLLLLTSLDVRAEVATRAGFVARLTKPVRLPDLYDAMVRAVAPLAVEPSSPIPWSPVAAAGSRGTLLIVEDHAINQEVAKGIAVKLGYGCDVAADGVEALAALARRSYDAVLMDCYMPEMDGYQATAEIRRREAGQRHTPIVAMTAGALADERDKCLAAGMDDFLAKPVKAEHLDAVLQRWIASTDVPLPPDPADDETVPDDGGVLDLEQFDDLRELATSSRDPDFLAHLVGQFLDEAAAQLSELRKELQPGHGAALARTAHGLKGSSATMGARTVASACAALERAAGRGEVAGPEDLDRITAELESAATALWAQVQAPGR